MAGVLRKQGKRRGQTRGTARRALSAAALSFLLYAAAMSPMLAEGARGGELRTNQHFLEDLNHPPAFDIADLAAVFEFVLNSLPPEVKVYPTENYYYFTFLHGGIDYAGNIRLAAIDRDQGIVHFAYFPAATLSSREGEMRYKPLTAVDGVTLTKLGALTYRVSYRGHDVVFHLNDLSGVAPPADLVTAAEDYIGPIQDESGLQFYLLFNRELKIFHYVLNEQAPVPEELRATDFSERILIGRRTGYALYQDQRIDRKILIGVHFANASVNNYYDGPFDQLPDNFLDGDALKEALEASIPSVAGRIDRYGYFSTGEGRFLIGPYVQYSSPTDLVAFDLCATNAALPPEQYYACFAIQGGGR
jgi:hypothetical protein